MHISLSAFAPDNLVSPDGFRQSRSASACSSLSAGLNWCLLTGSLPSFAAASIYLFKIATRHRVSPEFIGSRNCVYQLRSLPRVRRHRTSIPQGSSERVLPWQVTMDQLICASLSHTYYWYEVGMLKVPAKGIRYESTLEHPWQL